MDVADLKEADRIVMLEALFQNERGKRIAIEAIECTVDRTDRPDQAIIRWRTDGGTSAGSSWIEGPLNVIRRRNMEGHSNEDTFLKMYLYNPSKDDLLKATRSLFEEATILSEMYPTQEINKNIFGFRPKMVATNISVDIDSILKSSPMPPKDIRLTVESRLREEGYDEIADSYQVASTYLDDSEALITLSRAFVHLDIDEP